jgi:hypothetical protein
MSTLTELMRTALAQPRIVKQAVALDDATFDGVESGDSYTETDIKLKTAAAISQWTETDDLDDGETLADRLLALIVGIADANKDGDITDDEQGVLDLALNDAWDYFTKYGVDDADAGALLNDWDADAADRIRDLIASSLGDGDTEIDAFAFGDSDQEAMMDDATLDAVYKKRLVVRGGKKVRINKRISGHVRLSAKQKISVKKMQMKSHRAGAMMHRLKSNKLRQRLGMNK